MPVNIWLCTDSNVSMDHSQRVKRIFDLCPGPIRVAVGARVSISPDREKVLSWSRLFSELARIRLQKNIPSEDIVFLLTATANELNFYSAENPNGARDAFGHVGDFSWATRAPSEVISAHYVLLTVFKALVGDQGRKWEEFSHREKSRGCFSDFCQMKADIDLKLRTGDICGDCLSKAVECNIPEPELMQAIAIMQVLRARTVGIGPYLPAEEIFARWPFPIAITRHKAKQAIGHLARLKSLIDHLDSLVRHSYLIVEALADSRPVISGGPALGDWVRFFGEAVRLRRPNLLPAFREIETSHLVKVRNDFIGHDYSPADVATLDEPIAQMEESLEKIEATLDPFLSSHKLVVPQSLNVIAGSYKCEVLDLTGSHLLHKRSVIALDRPPTDLGISQHGDIHICDIEMKQFKTLGSNVRLDTCPECKHKRLLVTDGGDVYLDVFAGHRARL